MGKASPALIGAFVVGAVTLAVVGVLVFGSGRFFRHTTRAVCFFSGDLMGLNVGAPVKFKGVDVGTVADIRIRLPEEQGTVTPEMVKAGVRMPVIIEIDNEKVIGEGASRAVDLKRLKELIDLGLRAQLVSQSLVTGLLLVKLDFEPDIPATYTLPSNSPLLEIPTIPTTLQQAQAAAQDIIRRLEQIDFKQLVRSATEAIDGVRGVVQSPALQKALDGLPETLANVNQAVTDLRNLAARLDSAQGPLVTSLRTTSDQTAATVEEAKTTLKSAQALMNPDSPLAVELTAALREVSAAARSVRLLADYLERNPSAVVRGKEELPR